MDWQPRILTFAQEEPKPAPRGPDAFDPTMFLPLVAMAVLFYFLLIRPQRREQANREAMLSALKKNDRVVTVGGMLGTVANISADGQEVTLKVDDNTRVRMVRSSIQRIVSPDGETDKSGDSK